MILQHPNGDNVQMGEGQCFVASLVTEDALYRFNYRPGQYVNADRLASMEQLSCPNAVSALLAHERIERRISKRLLRYIGSLPVGLEDLSDPYRTLAINDYGVIYDVCVSAAARSFSQEISQLFDGPAIREVIALIGVRRFQGLCTLGRRQRSNVQLTRNLADAINVRAQNYLAGWCMAQPAAIRKRVILKTPPNTLATVFTGDLRQLIAELETCVKELRNA